MNNLEVFKDICMDMYHSSDIVEKRGRKIVYEVNYGKVVGMILQTKYKDLIPMDGLALEQIGYLFGTSRERMRQIEENILGSSSQGNSKAVKKVGILMSPKIIGAYNTSDEKISAMIELRDTLRVVYGEETAKQKRARRAKIQSKRFNR